MSSDYTCVVASQLNSEFLIRQLSHPDPILHLVKDASHAAVSLIIEPAATGHWSILFIQRATKKGDPWSGQIAFPGGRRENIDVDEEAVALRETEEEIGIRINSTAVVGRLDDLHGRHGGTSAGMVISCFVYVLDHIADVKTNYEVQNVLRIPVDHLLNMQNYVNVRWSRQQDIFYPGVALGDINNCVVWGLTYRFLRLFFHRLGCQLPESAIFTEQNERLRHFY